jgi:DNA-binding NarL/FixJ family response regulator
MPALGKTILIINDEPQKAFALKRLLKNEPGLGCEIQSLENFSKDGLREILKVQDKAGFPIAVIITDDVINKELDGITVANIAACHEGTKAAVLIKTMWESPTAAIKNHAMIKGFFNKNSRYSELVDCLKSQLSTDKSSSRTLG